MYKHSTFTWEDTISICPSFDANDGRNRKIRISALLKWKHIYEYFPGVGHLSFEGGALKKILEKKIYVR
jgi:hypothetical protein